MPENSGNILPGDSRQPEDGAVRRLRILLRFFLVWALLIILRLLQLQIFSHGDYSRLARSQQERLVELPAPRGSIFDREGRPLAMSLPLKSICVNPMLVPDGTVAVEVLARVLNLDGRELRERLGAAASAGRGFLWVKRRVSQEEFERVSKLKLLGVEFRDETARSYPKATLAAHVVGGVDHEGKGNAGIELGLDEDLEGIPGTVRQLKDVKDRGYESRIETKPQPGKNITLTIDERVQFVAERELRTAVEGCRCKTGSIVVMSPKNGDILAMASYPAFDPNEPVAPGQDLSARLNQAVAAPFEPGSVFKVITLSAALETTRLGPDSPINCLGGAINLYGRTIHEAKRGFGVMPMRMVLAKSSNIGAIQIGLQTGVWNLHHYIMKFGFGRRTGLPLPAESPGQVFAPRRWSKGAIASVSMGHEVMVTTLQLAQAAAVIASGGNLVRPRIVLKRQRPGERAEWEPVPPPVRVLRPENAGRMREMMHGVVLPPGTGTRAAIAGFIVGGKTGSAQIYDYALKQYTHKYNASFMGIAPLRRPAVVVVVSLNGSSGFGGAVAAPVFRRVTAAALRILDVPKDHDESAMVAQARTAPEPDAENDLAIAPLTPGPQEAAGTVAAEGVLLAETAALGKASSEADRTRAPNLIGKTMKDVLNETTAAGIQVEARGSGLARNQRPAPGVVLPPGGRMVVQFSR
ncbi:MAG: transpeptidase family protein [Acidobacteria bacterium]|nr:transpeptidase family protein [Acidobacteriota bacterium]